MKDQIILKEGTKIGKCKILKIIGKGGMGIVYKGYHEVLCCEVAIKTLYKKDKKNLEIFFKEAQAIAKLEHPNIIKIYDIEFDKKLNIPYIVVQFIDGKTLEEIIKEKKNFHYLEALNIIKEVAKGLLYAHQQGIIHRDIKPSNIMMDNKGNIKIMDFGLAYNFNIESKKDKVMGTPEYMAPEQCKGGKLDPRTDIYSLGATFFHLLTGQPPFDSNLPVIELMKCHLYKNPPKVEDIIPEIPPEISKCVMKMMSKSKEERFQNCEELLSHIQELEKILKKVKCPYCGKENSIDNVFNCRKCGTQNLCLTHLVPEKQYCERCRDRIKTSRKTLSYLKRQQWIEILQKAYKKNGLIHINSPKTNSHLIFTVNPEVIEIRTTFHSLEELKNHYNIYDTSEEEIAKKVIPLELLKTFTWEDIRIKFYPFEEHPRTLLLPSTPTHLYLQIEKNSFIKRLESIVNLYYSIEFSGGIIVKGAHKIGAVLFTSQGYALYKTREGKECFDEIIKDKNEAVRSIVEIFTPDCASISYQQTIFFPDLSIKELFENPYKEDILNMLINSFWEEIYTTLPSLERLIPKDILKWTEINTYEIKRELASLFKWEIWYEKVIKKSKISRLEGYILIIALVKELLKNIIEYVLEYAKKYIKKEEEEYIINIKNINQIENLLKEILTLTPTNSEVLTLLGKICSIQNRPLDAAMYFSSLGDIYFQSENFNEAIKWYNKALSYSPKLLQPNLKLIEIYYLKKDTAKVRSIGKSLINHLRKERDEENLEKVCNLLLDIDSTLIECRKELINIYLNRNDLRKAINEYEELANFYKQLGNIEELRHCYVRILKLDPTRKDIREKLNILNQLDSKDIENDIFLIEDIEDISKFVKTKTYYKPIILTLIILISIIFLFKLFYIEVEDSLIISLAKKEMELNNYDKANKFLNNIKGYSFLGIYKKDVEKLKKECEKLKKIYYKNKKEEQIRERKYFKLTLEIINRLKETEENKEEILNFINSIYFNNEKYNKKLEQIKIEIRKIK